MEQALKVHQPATSTLVWVPQGDAFDFAFIAESREDTSS
jgi:hypothetical protein